jgi:hypothetical protein
LTEAARPTLAALVEAAVDATAAAQGWLLAVDGDELVVVAAAGGASPGNRVGNRRAVTGTVGYVAGSGQPAALRVSPDDSSNEGAGGLDGVPTGILAVPCGDEDVIGVLELVDKAGGEDAFSFDDVEIVSLLARVAGAALADSSETAATVPSPGELAGELERLAAADAARYAAVATMLQAVLGQS